MKHNKVFKAGDKVLVVGVPQTRKEMKDQVYTVKEFLPDHFHSGNGIRLEEIDRSTPFLTWRFKLAKFIDFNKCLAEVLNDV